MSLSNSGLHLPDLPENFDLSDVRTEIDSIDKQILDLFVQRMHAADRQTDS